MNVLYIYLEIFDFRCNFKYYKQEYRGFRKQDLRCARLTFNSNQDVCKLNLTICKLLLVVFACTAQAPIESIDIPVRHKQVLFVTAADWDCQTGLLQRYDRTDNQWIPTGEEIPVVLGRNGMGWGRGLHPKHLRGPEKIEGDGKAPAGIFELGVAFGYDSIPPVVIKLPYRQSTARDYWVDAVSSSDYNTWVSIDEDRGNNPKKYWTSFERMKRADHLYELGVVVKHNMEPAIPPKGSAIFLHIWRTPGSPTSGCTAMSKQNLTALLSWLDPKKAPLLIQIPTPASDLLVYQ